MPLEGRTLNEGDLQSLENRFTIRRESDEDTVRDDGEAEFSDSSLDNSDKENTHRGESEGIKERISKWRRECYEEAEETKHGSSKMGMLDKVMPFAVAIKSPMSKRLQ